MQKYPWNNPPTIENVDLYKIETLSRSDKKQDEKEIRKFLEMTDEEAEALFQKNRKKELFLKIEKNIGIGLGVLLLIWATVVSVLDAMGKFD